MLHVKDTSLTVLLWTLGPGTAIWAALLTWWLTVRMRRRQSAAAGKLAAPDRSAAELSKSGSSN